MQEAERAGGDGGGVSEVVHDGWYVDCAVDYIVAGRHSVSVGTGIHSKCSADCL